MGPGDLLQSLLIGASSRGQLFFSDPVGGSHVLQHVLHRRSHLCSCWTFTFPKAINVQLGNVGYTSGETLLSFDHQI